MRWVSSHGSNSALDHLRCEDRARGASEQQAKGQPRRCGKIRGPPRRMAEGRKIALGIARPPWRLTSRGGSRARTRPYGLTFLPRCVAPEIVAPYPEIVAPYPEMRRTHHSESHTNRAALPWATLRVF